MLVTKKDGTTELLNISKISKAIEWACIGTSAKPIDIESLLSIHFYDGITTREIDNIVLQVLKDNINTRNLDYDKVYAKLYSLSVRKQVLGESNSNQFPSLEQFIGTMVSQGHYSPELASTTIDLSTLNQVLDHDRDFTFSGAGIEYLTGKYSIQVNKQPVETPQFLFMAVAMTLFPTNQSRVIDMYEALSTFKISLPSPAMTALRTGSMDIASCIKIATGDSLDSWNEAARAAVLHTAASAGVGVDISAVASIGDIVKGGKINHAGKIPLLKKLEADINSAVQNKRRGSGLGLINFFDPEVNTILGIASPRTEVNKRIVNLSYTVKCNQLIYNRATANQDITLFSVRTAPELDALFNSTDTSAFIARYEQYEREFPDAPRVSARELLESILESRTEISKHYILNIDTVNLNTPFLEPIRQSQICNEICLPTVPVSEHRRNSPDIAVCILTNINMGTVPLAELPFYTKLVVDMLNDNVCKQVHPTTQAQEFVRQYMALGIGVSNTAYFLAKQGVRYGSAKGLELVDQYMEHFTYGLYKASMEYARDTGAIAPKFNKTKMANGWLPIDNPNFTTDLVNRKLDCDWDTLRNNIAIHSMANTCLSAIPPSETSAVVGGQSNSIYPVKDLITIKSTSTSVTKMIVPEAYKLADKYDFVYTPGTNRNYLKTVCVMQKWIDQSISADVFYDPEHNDGKLSMKQMMSDLYFAYIHGMKGFYYQNIFMKDEEQAKLSCEGCEV